MYSEQHPNLCTRNKFNENIENDTDVNLNMYRNVLHQTLIARRR